MRKRTSVCLLMALVLYASQVWSDTRATKEECVMKCHEAAALINSKGLEEAISRSATRTGPLSGKIPMCF